MPLARPGVGFREMNPAVSSDSLNQRLQVRSVLGLLGSGAGQEGRDRGKTLKNQKALAAAWQCGTGIKDGS